LKSKQAFICAVQLDKNHVEAWINLGLLYESASQPQDALACYQNAAIERPVPTSVAQRAKFLKSQISSIPLNALAGAKQKQLPSVEEAWNTQVFWNIIHTFMLEVHLTPNHFR